MQDTAQVKALSPVPASSCCVPPSPSEPASGGQGSLSWSSGLSLHGNMKLSSVALSLAAHPTEPVLAAGLLSGGLAFGSQAHFHEIQLPGSTRAVCFSQSSSPSSVWTASDSRHLSQVDPVAKKAVVVYQFAEEHPSLCCLTAAADGILVAGDDDGGLHLFDARDRSRGPVASVLEQGDFVSGICCRRKDGDAALTSLIVSSGDGTLSAYDARMSSRRKLRLVAVVPSFEDDLLSLTLLESSGRAVAGTLSGALNVYDLKLLDADEDEPDMSRFVDRFYGHPESVSAVVSYEPENIVLTGSSDGIVRVVDPLQKILGGVLRETLADTPDDADESENSDESDGSEGTTRPGEGSSGANGRKETSHRNTTLWPVEGMAFLNGTSRPTLAVIGHTARVRFCDASVLRDEKEEEEEEECKAASEDVKQDAKQVSKKRKRDDSIACARTADESFFDGL